MANAQPQPTTPDELDPWTEIYRALHGILAAAPGLLNFGTAQQKTGIIQPGNFPDYSLPNFKPPADDFASAPYLVLLPSRDKFNPQGRNSLVCSLVQSFTISTGSKLTSLAELNAVKWLVLKAMAAAPGNLGLNYVAGWEMTDGGDTHGGGGFAFNEPKTLHWRSLVGITVAADINRASLLGTT